MKLLVGLGNPGGKFARNRHNIGFIVVERMAETYALSPWRRRFQGEVSEGLIGSARCLLLKPQTYMNESGRSVGEAARFFKLAPADIVIFHDELDLAPGKVRVKSGGGNAGHNGLRSITAHIGNDYQRVRIGIGHPGRKDLVHRYVLQDFAKSDQSWLEPLIDAIARAGEYLAAGDTANFMNDVARQIQSTDAGKTGDGAGPGSISRPAHGRPEKAGQSSRPSKAGGRPSQRDLARQASGARIPPRDTGETDGDGPKQDRSVKSSISASDEKKSGVLADKLKKWLGQRDG